MAIREQEALDYHAQGRPGKIQVTSTKPFKDQRDLEHGEHRLQTTLVNMSVIAAVDAQERARHGGR